MVLPMKLESQLVLSNPQSPSQQHTRWREMSTYRRIYKAALSPNLAEMIKPKKIEETGKWRRPILSRRKQADIRKNAILNGTYGQFNTETGCWCLPALLWLQHLFIYTFFFLERGGWMCFVIATSHLFECVLGSFALHMWNLPFTQPMYFEFKVVG